MVTTEAPLLAALCLYFLGWAHQSTHTLPLTSKWVGLGGSAADGLGPEGRGVWQATCHAWRLS